MQTTIALTVFLVSLALIASEKVNRSIVAMIGASLIILTGVLNFHEALESIDFNVLGLLIGMMIIVQILGKTGIFEYTAIKSVKLAKGRPVRLLFILALVTALFSAFLDNVTTIILIVPTTLFIARILNISPYPFVLTEIFFSNIGGTTTIIGDPPNIIIASALDITFNEFLLTMLPIISIIIIISLFITYLLFKNKLREKIIHFKKIEKINTEGVIKDKLLLQKSLLVLGLVLFGFFTHNIFHIEASVIALFGAFLLLLITNEEVEKAYEKIEWQTIFFFIGLFIIIGALEKVGVLEIFAELIKTKVGEDELKLSTFMLGFSGLSSGFIDNIPITIVLVDLVKEMGQIGLNIKPLWVALTLGADLGGNMTMIGASANVVGIDIYKRSIDTKKEKNITFMNFMRYGFPITISTLIISLIFIVIKHLFFYHIFYK
ncbi:MAG: membrane protein [Patescibacteria group bacterium]|nr:MAG: membrane protein [Patescibacteria group bacterium]